MIHLLKTMLLVPVKIWLYIRNSLKMRTWKLFQYDCERFSMYSGAITQNNEVAHEALIMMEYHIIEKGLTMPNRRMAFGKQTVIGLIQSIESYISKYPLSEQVKHAIGVLKAYENLHQDYPKEDASEYWNTLNIFCKKHSNVQGAEQIETTASDYWAQKDAPFPCFAKSRRMIRNYTNETIPFETIHNAIALAMTAPSACNRQYSRVYCITDKKLRDEVLSLQNGNRGFGHMADKLLIVTGDLRAIRWLEERNDLFTNVGMFLMNLCYALHYYEIAHCILNWSVNPEKDNALRALLPQIPNEETIVAILTLGKAPEAFSMVVSPRKELSEIYTEIK